MPDGFMKHNPYQPPPSGSIDRPPGLLSRIRAIFQRPLRPVMIRELRRDSKICCGIAYYVDSDSPNLIHAVSPSTRTDDDRMKVVTDVVESTLIYLEEVDRKLAKDLPRCQLQISLCESYATTRRPIRVGPMIAPEMFMRWCDPAQHAKDDE